MLVTDARMLIRSHADLLAGGRTDREIATAVRSSSLHRLSRGLYLEADVWHGASPEERETLGADADRDLDAMEWFRESAMRHLLPGSRGVRNARRVLDIADGRVQLPGEAISLMYLLDLGFARPRLQVPVAVPSGTEYFVDFGLDDADVWGEFDGRAKYLDPAMRRAGESVEDAVLREKSREDWIRCTDPTTPPRQERVGSAGMNGFGEGAIRSRRWALP
jgi:hypothetical protein